MKSTIKLLLLCATLFFAYPTEATAQKGSKTVKKHVKRHHKIKNAKKISRHRYSHLPKRGKTVRKLGAGSVGINFKGAKLFVQGGVWYRLMKRNRYIFSKAPIGVRVNRLPKLVRPRIIVGTKVYHYYYGTYYEKVANTEEYSVVKAPIGAKIDALPEGFDTVEVNGVTYYRLDDVYYEFIVNSDDDAYFIVTKAP